MMPAFDAVYDSLHFKLYWLSIGLFTMSLFLQLVVKCSDPGFLKHDDTLNFMTLLEKVKFDDLCTACMVLKTPRSRHCLRCNACVDRYDHHCGWLDLCIGRGNLKRFHLFVGILMMYIIHTVVCLCYYLNYEFLGIQAQSQYDHD